MKYLLVIAAVFFFAPPSAHALWLDSNWDYRVQVQVVPSKVGTTSAITSFPVYNDCGGFPTSFWTNANSAGADIRVAESDGLTETAFELVSFSTTSKKCELHFMADSLATTSTSTFYIYYGNPGASAYTATSTYGRNAVWTDYVSVWHFDSTTDSKGSNDLTYTSITTQTGNIGNSSVLMNATTDRIEAANESNFDRDANTNPYTVSMYYRPTSDYADNRFLFSKQPDGSPNWSGYSIYAIGTTQGTSKIRFAAVGNSTGAAAIRDTPVGSLTAGTWGLWHFTYDGSVTMAGILAYKNGMAQTMTDITSTFTGTLTNSVNARIGNRAGYNANHEIDEVRVRFGTVLTPAWILTEYNNQSATSTFFAIGSEETETAPEATSTPSSGFGPGMFSGGIFR